MWISSRRPTRQDRPVAPSLADLPVFNRLVQLHQARLYAIAYHTLGSHPLAEAATQAAVEDAYHQGAGRVPARSEAALLACLVAALRRACLTTPPPPEGLLGHLPFDLRLPLVLIDVAGLSYDQAAEALHTSLVELIQQLAHGRRRLCGQSTSTTEG